MTIGCLIQISPQTLMPLAGSVELVASLFATGEPAALVEVFLAWCDRHQVCILDV